MEVARKVPVLTWIKSRALRIVAQGASGDFSFLYHRIADDRKQLRMMTPAVGSGHLQVCECTLRDLCDNGISTSRTSKLMSEHGELKVISAGPNVLNTASCTKIILLISKL